MSNLYELTSDYAMLLEMAEDPEADRELVNDTLEALEGDLEAKLENYSKVVRQMEYDAAAAGAEEKRFRNKRQTIERSIAYMKSRMMESMKITGKKSVKTELFNISIRKNGGLAPLVIKEGLTPDDVPENFVKVKKEFDNEAIRKAIAENDCGFAYLGERGESLSIK